MDKQQLKRITLFGGTSDGLRGFVRPSIVPLTVALPGGVCQEQCCYGAGVLQKLLTPSLANYLSDKDEGNITSLGNSGSSVGFISHMFGKLKFRKSVNA